MSKLLSPALLGLGMVLFGLSLPLSAQESFQVNLDEDGETIGDMRPVFLKFSSRSMPDISPAEVARRYQRLFDESEEPEVRIDALNRLANLQDQTGEDLAFTADQEEEVYREAVESYERIVGSGSFQGRLDELLYQSAKAYSYIGQESRSVERLKQMVGLYPSSGLVPEARFRIAEAAYANGNYVEAETGYRQVLEGPAEEQLKSKARYMLGWSQFKQGDSQRAGETFIAVLDEYSETSGGFTYLPTVSADMIRDAFRVIGIIAVNNGGQPTLEQLLSRVGGRSYDFLLYDGLADYYASRGDYEQSARVARTFVEEAPDHYSTPAFRAQIVEVWDAAGEAERARDARAEYLEAYESGRDVVRLTEREHELWLRYAETLAEHYYRIARAGSGGPDSGSDPDSADTPTDIIRAFERAGHYYEILASEHDQPGPIHLLAGDAWLQAGDHEKALAMYESAGYQDPDFAGAEDAAWAGITLRTDLMEKGAPGYRMDLNDLASTADRFALVFPGDSRLPTLQADLANRLLDAGRPGEAGAYAIRAIEHDEITPPDAYSAWLVLGQAEFETQAYPAAEKAWREALAYAVGPEKVGADTTDIANIRLQLATAIYRQAELAEQNEQIDQAVAHYQRIAAVYPGSEIAIKGQYDAANTLLKAERWQPAVNELKRFRNDHASHELTEGVSDKLVFAYQSSGQPVRAADELVSASAGDAAGWQKRLKAAELYHESGELESRNRLYQQYLAQAGRPDSQGEHLRQQRQRQRLIESGVQAESMRSEMVRHELASDWHSSDSLAWATGAALVLAEASGKNFRDIKLVQPLPESLARKRKSLDQTRELYRQAETLGGDSAQSESLYHRAELYRILARDIMESAPPQGLSELELSQYQFLVEEQAYPFEEKAIELHARNHELISEGVYDRWVKQSLEALEDLFPGRYARDRRWISWNEGPGNDV
ncbi:tetratricopeptide repeat protein [Marinobacter salicampi]|uniref:tetratricopeptide repeat protein n=1 Tax=Marinobacter salicampi TaxID=435907 RepID=UPI0014099C00|nr:tetratricopeptide repeat protein [Marinobacter salicampi]